MRKQLFHIHSSLLYGFLGKKNASVLLLSLVFWSCISFGQTAKVRIDSAQNYYNVGAYDSVKYTLNRLEKSPEMLKMARSYKAEVFRLQALVCLYNRETADADYYLKKMLENMPSYKKDTLDKDLGMFKNYLSKLYPVPRFTVGIQAGQNFMFVDKIESFSHVELQNKTIDKKYTTGSGFELGALIDFRLRKLWTVSFAPSFTYKKYNLEREVSGLSNYKYNQSNHYIHFPLYLKYSIFPKSSFSPYLMAGGYMGYLSASVKNVLTDDGTKSDVSILMNKTETGASVGGGICYKIGKLFIVGGQIRYDYSFSSVTDVSKRLMSDPQTEIFLYKYYDVNDHIRLHGFTITGSISIILNYKVF